MATRDRAVLERHVGRLAERRAEDAVRLVGIPLLERHHAAQGADFEEVSGGAQAGIAWSRHGGGSVPPAN